MYEMTALEDILFNPCQWIHPKQLRIPEMFDSADCRKVLNQILIKHFQLSVTCQDAVPGPFAAEVVDNWRLLPHTAYLLACRHYRAALVYQGDFEKLPQHAQQFSELSVSFRQPVRFGYPVDIEELEHGGLQILEGLTRQLPLALSQRIPLLFSASARPAFCTNDLPEIAEIDLKRAIEYAKNRPIF